MESQTLKQGRGRPSKYKAEYPNKLLEYFAEALKDPIISQLVEKTTKYYQTGQVKETFERYKPMAKSPPTLFRFALDNGISYRVMHKWANERDPKAAVPEKGTQDKRPFRYPDFVHAYKLAQEFQKEFLLAAGMSGAAPAPFAIFAAKNMIGWRDSMDSRLVDKDGKDRKIPGYVLLPTRKTEEEAEREFEDQENDGEIASAQ